MIRSVRPAGTDHRSPLLPPCPRPPPHPPKWGFRAGAKYATICSVKQEKAACGRFKEEEGAMENMNRTKESKSVCSRT